MGLLDERIDHRLCVFASYSGEEQLTAVKFDQGCDLAVLATEQEITLPVARYRMIFSLSRPLADRDGIGNPAMIGCLLRVMP